MRDEQSNSAGCGGVGPAGITNRFAMSVATTPALALAVEANNVLNPASLRRFRARWIAGRRMSASTSRTRAPDCASTTAVLMLVVVLPSCGSGLVTTMIFGGAPGDDSISEVRKARYASETCERGRE